jgi:hypothetical protein
VKAGARFLADVGAAIDALRRADDALGSLPSPAKRRLTPSATAIGAHRLFLGIAHHELALASATLARLLLKIARQR